MKNKYLVASLALVGLIIASTAFADSINYSTGPVAGAIVYDFESDIVGPLSGAYTLGSLGVITNTYKSIISNSSNGDGAEPAGDFSKYLSVKGDGATTITLSNPNNYYFGLLWGSMDTYNTIKFTFIDGAQSVSYTGRDVASLPGANGSWDDSSNNKYVNFTFSNAIKSVTLTSGSNSFEVDNLAVAPVPEPATMLLFGTGLVCLVGVIRRKKS
jgi:hypothetical protein